MKKTHLYIAIQSILLLFSASAFAQNQASNITQGFEQPKTKIAGLSTEKTPTLNSILADNIQTAPSVSAMAEVSVIRAEALQEAAVSLGARAGLAKRLNDIAISIEKQTDIYDKSFNFTRLTIAIPSNEAQPTTGPKGSNGEIAMLLPPILLDGRDADSVPNEDEMRLADRIYKIHQKSKLVPVDKRTGIPAVPNWRDYLIFSFQEVQMPHHALLPKNDAEKILWNDWVLKGWKEGEKQAEDLFENGFARLKRDFHGMLKARLAFSQGVLTLPMVAGVNMGVTGGGSEMRLNDRVIRITDQSALVPDPKRWTSNNPE